MIRVPWCGTQHVSELFCPGSHATEQEFFHAVSRALPSSSVVCLITPVTSLRLIISSWLQPCAQRFRAELGGRAALQGRKKDIPVIIVIFNKHALGNPDPSLRRG